MLTKPEPAVIDHQILELQAHAVATNDMVMLDKCYTALGFGRRVQIVPLEGEVKLARQWCADQIEMMRLTGEVLRTPVAP